MLDEHTACNKYDNLMSTMLMQYILFVSPTYLFLRRQDWNIVCQFISLTLIRICGVRADPTKI